MKASTRSTPRHSDAAAERRALGDSFRAHLVRTWRRGRSSFGIEHVLQGIGDKLAAFARLSKRLGLAPEQTGYMGDDLVDIPVLARCGFACAPSESPEESARAGALCLRGAGRTRRGARGLRVRDARTGNHDRVLQEYLK